MKRIRLTSIVFATMALVVGIVAASASAVPVFTKTFSFGLYGTEEGRFKSARGMDTDAAGNVWVADMEVSRIEEFSPTGGYLATITGSGEHKLKSPWDLAIAPEGNIWVMDTGLKAAVEFKPNGEYIREIKEVGEGYLLAVDSKGNVWLGDPAGIPKEHVYKYNSAGVFQKSVKVSQYNHFQVDSKDNLLVSSYKEGLSQYSSEGSYLGQIGKGVIIEPEEVTVDTEGNIWVVDYTKSGRFMKGFNSKGEYLTQFDPGHQTGPLYSLATAAGGGIWIAFSAVSNQIEKWSEAAPDTTITGGSAGKVTPDVSFTFSSNVGGASFECALDAGAYAACSSPKSYEGLTEGSHTFKVRAVNGSLVDPTPAQRTVEVKEVAKAVSSIAVLDEFARSEEPLANGKWTKTSWAAEIGASWTGPWHGYGAIGSTLAGAYWNGASFSDATAGLLVSATVGTGSTAAGEYMALWLDMPSPGSARSGYEARFTGTNGSASAYKVELSKWVAGTRTVLGTKEGFSLPVNTTFVLTETGGKLTLWTGTSSFTRVLSAYDSTYSSGYAGIEVNQGEGTAYNFRAGNVQ